MFDSRLFLSNSRSNVPTFCFFAANVASLEAVGAEVEQAQILRSSNVSTQILSAAAARAWSAVIWHIACFAELRQVCIQAVTHNL